MVIIVNNLIKLSKTKIFTLESVCVLYISSKLMTRLTRGWSLKELIVSFKK